MSKTSPTGSNDDDSDDTLLDDKGDNEGFSQSKLIIASFVAFTVWLWLYNNNDINDNSENGDTTLDNGGGSC
jgi:hypothetical protein